MAGDWIKMRSELQSHPKVVRILSATESDKFRVIGGLHAVWSVFDTHSTTGELFGYTPDSMDHVIGWPGFSAAMLAVKWLLFDGDQTLTLPEFDEHNSKGAKRRAEDQKRKRNDRRDEDESPPPSGRKSDKKRTREEKSREEPLTASLSLGAGEGEGGLLVTDGNGKPTAPLGDAQAIGVGVPAAKRLRAIGIRVTALDPTLLALCAEKFTIEDMALMAAEQVLRKVHLFGDPDVHPELPELLASAATQQQMLLTPAQYTAIQAAAAEIGINYLATALRGRRQDAIDKQSPNRSTPKHGARKPSSADNFEGKNYVGTSVDNLSPELRARVASQLAD
jgi:hypothetical protein